jgi:hypothetical protein
VDWAGILFAALVLGLAIPFALPHFRSPDSPLRSGGAKALLVALIAVGLLLGLVNVVRALGMFENHSAYWGLNLALSALFWVLLLRLSWRERRQRPR